jgi:ankyrin repeat protein
MRYHNSVLLTLAFSGIILFSLIIGGCKSGPSAKDDDVWSLLEKGEVERARPFFLGEVNVNDRDPNGRTPLHIAAELGDSALASFFISLGAEIDALDAQGRTPLEISTERLDASTAATLAAAGADIHRGLPGGSTAALRALDNGSLLAAILTPASINTTDVEGRTILHLAVIRGNAAAAEAAIKAGASLNKKDAAGKTALDLALARADSGIHMKIAEQLTLAGGRSEDALFSYFAPAVRSSNYNIRMDDGLALIHYAAREGQEGLIVFLLEKNADINIKNRSGATALHEAVRSGNVFIMERLINAGADINAQDAKGNTAMHIAAPAQFQESVLSLLLSRGANPNLRDEHGESPLHIAITLNRDPEIIRTLLRGGGFEKAGGSERADVSIRNIEGKTPLYLAVQHDRIPYIPLLLEYRSDIFAADTAGITPFERALRANTAVLPALINAETVLQSDSAGNTLLHLTAKNGGDPKTVGMILDEKALVNARNKEGDTSLHLAVRQNEEEAGKLLLSRGADIFAPNARGESPLYLSFHSEGGPRIWMLNPETLSARDGLGNTVLHYAAGWKLDGYIPMIVQRGAALEAVNATGETPLFSAIKADSPSTVQVLLAAGASIGARDTMGNSGLHAAVRWNAVNAAAALIAARANINAHASNGKTPLHDAVRLGITGMTAILIANGANLEVRDNDGNTPFMEAIMAGYASTAERLAELGSDPMIRNNRGDTPLHVAVGMERQDLINLLLNLGASIHGKNNMGRSPFQTALTISPRFVSTLLTKDRILVPDDEGHSPLHIAVLEDAPLNMLQTIINQGARLSAVDSIGYIPLRLAVEKKAWDMAKLLANAGSDVFSVADDGKTPAELALAAGNEGIRALFSGQGINARDSSGNTILHYAAKEGNAGTVSLLLELGANKALKNIAAESPADIARRWNKSDVAALLNG